MTTDVQSFAQNAGKLPSLPALYYELNEAVQNPDSSLEEIVGILEKDQGLSSRLLRLANSAFYGVPSQIGTLAEAVQIIGFRQVQDLVLSTSVIQAFQNVPEDLLDVGSFWKHSIACGLASALLARQRHDPVPERLFLGGLLHDIGRLVLVLKAPAESVKILRRCESEQALASPIEQQELGFDHAALGAELLRLWKLPLPLREMVHGHHNPGVSSVMFPDTFLIHYADFITSALQYGRSGEVFLAPLVVPDNCQRFLMEDDRVDLLAVELDQRCAEVFSILASPASA
jgi:HD-like signal output (HDOD) protein